MAKFELNVYDKDENVIKTHKRNKCTVELFLRFQQYSEKVTGGKVKNDVDFFENVKSLFLEMFPNLTAEEYNNNTDVAEVIALFNDIITKATTFTQAKNV